MRLEKVDYNQSDYSSVIGNIPKALILSTSILLASYKLLCDFFEDYSSLRIKKVSCSSPKIPSLKITFSQFQNEVDFVFSDGIITNSVLSKEIDKLKSLLLQLDEEHRERGINLISEKTYEIFQKFIGQLFEKGNNLQRNEGNVNYILENLFPFLNEIDYQRAITLLKEKNLTVYEVRDLRGEFLRFILSKVEQSNPSVEQP